MQWATITSRVNEANGHLHNVATSVLTSNCQVAHNHIIDWVIYGTAQNIQPMHKAFGIKKNPYSSKEKQSYKREYSATTSSHGTLKPFQ